MAVIKARFSWALTHIYNSIACLCAVSMVIGCEQGGDEDFADRMAPTVPVNLTASQVTDISALISWNPSTDNVGVKFYVVYQNNIQVSHDSVLDYKAVDLNPETQYEYSVRAVDEDGRISNFSDKIEVTTRRTIIPVDRVLIFSKTEEYRHTSIDKGIETIKELGANNNFEVYETESGSDFNAVHLQNYEAIIFLNTTGDVLDGAQQVAFENYIRSGGSYMGIHAATDTEYDWAWYEQLVGAYFDGHPEIQEARMTVLSAQHPATSHLGNEWLRTDEWYNFRDINSNLTVLLNLDESSYSGGTNGTEHPIAWYHEFDGGRSFYTGGGHTEAAYDEPDFRMHLLGGIEYCLGR